MDIIDITKDDWKKDNQITNDQIKLIDHCKNISKNFMIDNDIVYAMVKDQKIELNVKNLKDSTARIKRVIDKDTNINTIDNQYDHGKP